MKYAIETFGLTKRFGRLTAVDRLSLGVPTGSIFAFLGPNGAGKTTTIYMMMNILTASKGQARVLGVDSRQLGPRDFARIGYVSENQDLPEWMTAGQFLGYCKKMYPTWDDAFCGHLVRQFRLPLEQRLKNFSRGMKMKAALVSSLAYRPRLLVLDEPFSGLDPLVREEFIDGLLEITASEEWTIFISSHDINEVERLADWVGIVYEGRQKIVARTEDLQDRIRRVRVTLDQPVPVERDLPAAWLLPKFGDRSVEFYDAQFHNGETEQRVRALFPDCREYAVEQLSLRDIFVVLARQYRILDS